MSKFHNQSQFELFPNSPKPYQEPNQKRFLMSDMTLPLENIVVTIIIMIMGLVISYSFGVEKGKSLVLGDFPTSKNIDAKIAENDIIETPQQATIQVVETVAPAAEVKEEKIEVLEIPHVEEDEVIPEFSYTIQVASFKLEKNAEKEADTLKKKGFESLVMSKGSHSIVCVGKFLERQDALKFTRKLKNKYKDCLVRRL